MPTSASFCLLRQQHSIVLQHSLAPLSGATQSSHSIGAAWHGGIVELRRFLGGEYGIGRAQHPSLSREGFHVEHFEMPDPQWGSVRYPTFIQNGLRPSKQVTWSNPAASSMAGTTAKPWVIWSA